MKTNIETLIQERRKAGERLLDICDKITLAELDAAKAAAKLDELNKIREQLEYEYSTADLAIDSALEYEKRNDL